MPLFLLMEQFYSNNNSKLLSAIHKLNCVLTEVEVFSDSDVILEYVIDKQDRHDFHLHKGLGNTECSTLVCRICNNDKLIVGQTVYFTAIRCDCCGYEVGVHEG